MKKLLMVSNVLTLALLYLSSFKSPQKNEEKKDSGPCNPVCIDYTIDPITGIPLGTAKGMSSLYRSNQMKTLNTNQLLFKDAKSVWFSLDKLKSFIGEMESLTCAANCNNKLDLGIRIYIAAYPDLETMDQKGIKQQTAYWDVKNGYGKHLTLFMVPTYHDAEKQSQVDYDPRNMGTNACKPTPLKDLLNYKPGPGGMSNVKNIDIGTLNRIGIEPSEILPPSANKRLAVPGGATPNPPIRYNLILSAIEQQVFYRPSSNSITIKSIMNHGNTIPPDVDAGAAFQ